MRILAIRGANLASLADPFAIDLAAEPLASAGLFAITGETGAGKSTILDAMCLALYGDCPRLSHGGINDDVPDAAGDTIKAKDARAILRRGAAQGFAQVDFIAADGIAYQATWAARRARGRADGRLQNIERALVRLSDGKTLESQTSAVNARIVDITGLTYDEFRRTVLLAQGDFDAFLVAGTGERAALLEKVTGTRIYRDISRRVYERYGEAKAALKALEDKRSGAMALSVEERTALADERAGLVAAIGQVAEVLAALSAKIAVHEKISAARKRVEDATQVAVLAQEAVAAAAADREKLTLLDAALALAGIHDRVVRADKAVADLVTAENETIARQDTLAAAVQEADAAWQKASTGLEEAERSFKALGPQWTLAADLDSRIRTAEAESDRAGTALQDAERAVTVRRDALEGLVRGRDEHAAARDAAEADLAEKPQVQRVSDAWDTVVSLIEERTGVVGAITDAARAAETARTAAAEAQERITQHDIANRTDRDVIQALEQAIASAGTRLADIGKADPARRMTRLIEGDAAVKDMIRAAQEYAAAVTTHEKAWQDSVAAEEALAAAEASGIDARARIARAAAVVEALAAPVDRAEAAASEAAEHLRQHLVDGEPCPVCGATQHPVSADAALAAIAADMRAQLEAARTELAAATRAETEAGRKADTARMTRDAAAQSRETAEKMIAAAQAAFAEARHAALTTGLERLPQEPADAVATLVDLRSRIEGRRIDIAALVDEEDGLRREVEANRLLVAERRKAIEGREADRIADEASRTDSQTALGLADQTAEQAGQRLAAIDRQLTPIFEGVGLTPAAFDHASKDRLDDLERLVIWFRERLAARDNARDAVVAAEPDIRAARTDHDNAIAHAHAAAATRDARRHELSALQEERGQLLDGESTEEHRSRHNLWRIEAGKARDEAWENLSSLKSEQRGVEERLAGVRESLVTARAESSAAAANLDAGLAAAALQRDALEALLAEGKTAAERLRARLKTVDDDLVRARTTLGARSDDWQALVDAGVPKEPEADLRAASLECEAERSQKQERAGAIQGRLAADDAVRLQLSDLDHRIGEAKTVCDVWAAVNDAIGSARGDKFAQIAQGVTLLMLVERANQHLADLKPRYRLARGGADLALHIVDRDMGDEVRSTRSLSGGERFLVSLSLALALSRMGARGGLAATLFIDEGFGSLDAESLDVAIDALEALQAQGRTIGVISHVDAMKDRIPVQIKVMRSGVGASEIKLQAP
ncbi:AAA family ATPase [Pseudochelatococcus contaminans]|uniref:Exonuclease SbcC n=1 Tax=Pseudochelatococcus contaminans TaxID=1538103 RepID=A0A7W5Z325_9HYPH|nr:AAA family ATPase [Pseudochelatococcus contaminans]MBB3809187.1 exonuclease SbcC [Pseudochelatococcus contaminans]